MPERAVIVGLDLRSRKASRQELAAAPRLNATEESLAELVALAATAGAEVVGQVIQSRQAPQSATLIGSGKVKELASLAEAAEADVVIFDHNLTPTQQAEMETVLDDFVMYVQMLQAQMDDVRANGKARVMRVLDERQKKKFEQMLGQLQQARRQ